MSITPIEPGVPSDPPDDAAFMAELDSYLEGLEGGEQTPSADVPGEGEAATPSGDPSPPAAPDDTPVAPTDEVASDTQTPEIAPDDLTPPGDPITVEPPLVPGAGEGASPPPPGPPSDDVDLNVVFREYLQREPTRAETVEMLQFISDVQRVQQMDPQRAALLETVLYGDPATLQAPPAAPSAAPPTGQHSPAPAADPWATPPDDDIARDPRVDELAQRVAAYEQAQAEQIAAQQAQYQQWIVSEAEAGFTDFKQAAAAQGIVLDNNDYAILQANLGRTRAFDAALAANPNNPRAAYATALDTVMMQTPAYKQRVIDAAAQRRAEEIAVENARMQAASATAPAASAANAAPSGGVVSKEQAQSDAHKEAAMWLNSGEPTY